MTEMFSTSQNVVSSTDGVARLDLFETITQRKDLYNYWNRNSVFQSCNLHEAIRNTRPQNTVGVAIVNLCSNYWHSWCV